MSLIKPSDRIFVAGARGMAGSAITRALKRSGYGNPDQRGALLTPNREELDLLDDKAVCSWMTNQKPDVVVLAAATVGGIEANRSRRQIPASKPTNRNSSNRSSLAYRGRLLFLSNMHFKLLRRFEECLLTTIWNTMPGMPLRRSRHQALQADIQHNFDAISLMPTNLYGPGTAITPPSRDASLIRRFHEAKTSKVATVTCWGTGSPLGISACG